MSDEMKSMRTQTSDRQMLEQLAKAHAAVKSEIAKVIVGQNEVIDQILLAIFSRGHCILEGVPGLAKTLLVDSLAKALHVDFRRIQFTPDLMPSDVTGTEILQQDATSGARVFKFLKGPVFTNILLADEINRTPPKTQAALLESMQEKQVSVGGQRHALPNPFFVLATQNPIEQEGTYPLPEAQQDRFMFKIIVKYPSFDEERDVALRTTGDVAASVERVLPVEELLACQSLVRRVPVPANAVDFALHLVRGSRVHEPEAAASVKEWIQWGAGPRAVQYLLLGAKASAALEGRPAATIEDIQRVAHPVLRHRILVNFHAESEGVTPDAVIDRLVAHAEETMTRKATPKAVAAALK
jgi:MoxR-like ATPase